jgi:hypothetical protein
VKIDNGVVLVIGTAEEALEFQLVESIGEFVDGGAQFLHQSEVGVATVHAVAGHFEQDVAIIDAAADDVEESRSAPSSASSVATSRAWSLHRPTGPAGPASLSSSACRERQLSHVQVLGSCVVTTAQYRQSRVGVAQGVFDPGVGHGTA